MKKLLLIFALFNAFLCNAQGLLTTSGTAFIGAPGGSFLGVTYSKSNFVSGDLTNDFVTSGVGASVVSGKIHITSGSAANFNNYLCLKDTTCSLHYRFTVCWKFTSTKITGDFGISIGQRGVNSASVNSFGFLCDQSSNSTSGHPGFFQQSNSGGFPLVWTATQSVSNSTNDRMMAVVERNNQNLRIRLYNLSTQSASADTTITYPMSGGIIPQNTSQFAIYSNSASSTIDIDSIARVIYEPLNPDIAWLGDSKTLGYGASTWTTTWTSLLKQYWPYSVTFAGFGDRTQDALARVPEIIALHPRCVVISLGSNDLRTGISSTVWQANYDSIVVRLQRAGIIVLHTTGAKEGSLTQTTLVNFINSTFPGAVIDTFTLLSESGILYADGIHLNDKGNARYAEIIRTSPLLPNNMRSINPNQ